MGRTLARERRQLWSAFLGTLSGYWPLRPEKAMGSGVEAKFEAVFLSFTSYNLDKTGDYRQSLFVGVVNVRLLGYNLIILYSSFSFFYHPAAGPFFHLRYTKLNTTNQTRSLPSNLNSKTTTGLINPTIAKHILCVSLMPTVWFNVLLQTLGTNSRIVN